MGGGESTLEIIELKKVTYPASGPIFIIIIFEQTVFILTKKKLRYNIYNILLGVTMVPTSVGLEFNFLV